MIGSYQRARIVFNNNYHVLTGKRKKKIIKRTTLLTKLTGSKNWSTLIFTSPPENRTLFFLTKKKLFDIGNDSTKLMCSYDSTAVWAHTTVWVRAEVSHEEKLQLPNKDNFHKSSYFMKRVLLNSPPKTKMTIISNDNNKSTNQLHSWRQS